MTDLKPGKYAIFATSLGEITCELFPQHAPETVENFVGLATGTKEFTDPKTRKPAKRPFFDGLIFHRVIPEFMIQGGCPLGTVIPAKTGTHLVVYNVDPRFRGGDGDLLTTDNPPLTTGP